METEIKYHDGSVVSLDFNPKKHYYTVDGKYAPSVTTILDSIAKPALIPWAANQGAKFYLENHTKMDGAELAKGIRTAYRTSSGSAINIGMAVHKWCEEAILWKLGKGPSPKKPDMGEEADNSIHAFREWVKENDIEWISAEEKVFNREHGYAGTVDAVANVNDEFCVIDFKTSAAIYAPYHLQCAAYAYAIKDMHGKEVERAYVLRFDKKTGEFEARSSTELHENFLGFLGFLDGYRRLKTLENRK